MNVYQTVLALISMLVIGFLRRIRSLLPAEREGATAIRVCAMLGIVSGLLCTQFAYAANKLPVEIRRSLDKQNSQGGDFQCWDPNQAV